MSKVTPLSNFNNPEIDISKLRELRGEGDNMQPTINWNRDFALVQPVDEYDGDGIYCLSQGDDINVYRIECICDQAHIISDNKAYSMQAVSRDKLNSMIIGKVRFVCRHYC